MKKLLVLIFALTIGVSSLLASKKEVVYMGEITFPSAMKAEYVESLRIKVLAGLMSVDRVVIKDVKTAPGLKNKKESLIEDLQKLGADYLIQGSIISIGAMGKAREDQTVRYEGKVSYSLQIVDVKSGAIVTTENYNYPSGLVSFSTTGNTEAEAIENTLKGVEQDMLELVNNNFQLKAVILEVSKESGGKVQEVYIDLGSKDGIQKGQRFEVFVEKSIAGRIAESKVGEMQAEAVEADDLTRCKVLGKAQEAIKIAMNKGENVVVKSTASKGNVLDQGKRMFGL